MNHLFIDAETDGLYGKYLSIAAILCDEMGNEINQFYGYLQCECDDMTSDWVKENVYPYLSHTAESDKSAYQNEEEMLESFWKFYRDQGECYCVGDVIYPVEARLLNRCVNHNPLERLFQGPFPFLDISSMLYAIGMDPLVERRSLVNSEDLRIHNALDDVRMTIRVWKQFILKR